MTAPAPVGEITGRIAAIRAQIGIGQTRGTGASGRSATAFATELDGAVSKTAPSTAATSKTSTSTTAASAAGRAAAQTPAAPTGITGDTVVATAKQYLGVPYVWGGTSPSGLDCSGLVQLTFSKLGIDLPRVSRDQATVGEPVPSLDQARPGDLIAFGSPVDHIAIYVGDGKILEAPEPGKNVRIVEMFREPVAIRRIVDAGSAVTAATTGTDPTAIGTSPVTTALGIPPGFLTLWDGVQLDGVPRAVPLSSLGLSTIGTTTRASSGLTADQLRAAGFSDAVAGYASDFASMESAYNLPGGLLAAVAQAESAGRADAVSSAGAQGLMQLMPATAAALGVDDPFDPSQAIRGAARYLSDQLDAFDGSLTHALAAYNAGPGAVRQYGGIPPYAETQHYVSTITDMMARLP